MIGLLLAATDSDDNEELAQFLRTDPLEPISKVFQRTEQDETYLKREKLATATTNSPPLKRENYTAFGFLKLWMNSSGYFERFIFRRPLRMPDEELLLKNIYMYLL